jgi:MFS transporter, DHA3 family, macrolide efflux protein
MEAQTGERSAGATGASYQTFLIVWAGQLASGLGNGMTAFALAVHVYRETGAATPVSLVILCLFLPSILLRPVGGLLADRFDRRYLIVLGDLGSASGVLFLLVAALTGSLALWKIYLGVAVSSVFVALQSPAYKAAVTDLLSPQQFSRAGGLVQLASSAQHLVSPVLAGILMTVGGLAAVFIIDISTFGLAVLAALAINRSLKPARSAETKSAIGELKEGWAAVVSNPEVLGVVGVVCLATFFVGVLQTLFAPMVLSFSDPRTLGIAQSVSASGMLVSSLLLGIYGISRRHAELLVLSLAAAGLFLGLMGLTTHIVLITASFFLFFCALPVINTAADVLIRTKVPNETQGRAWGIIGLLSQLGFVVAYSISGLLADRVFVPLLVEGGRLAPSVGRVIGTGAGRGIGLMLVLCGVGVVLVAGFARRRVVA